MSEFIEELSYELLEDTLSQEFSIGYGEIDQILGGNVSLIISTLNSMNLVGVTIDVIEKKGEHMILVSSDNAKNFELACKEIQSFIENNGLSVKLLTIDRNMRSKCKKMHQISAIKYLLENYPKVSMIQMNEKSTNVIIFIFYLPRLNFVIDFKNFNPYFHIVSKNFVNAAKNFLELKLIKKV